MITGDDYTSDSRMVILNVLGDEAYRGREGSPSS